MSAQADNPLVLVTGGSGLIGSAVVRRMAPQYRMIALDIVELRNPPAGAEWVRLDIGSDEGVRAALEQVRREHGEWIASVIHLAAYYDFSGEPSDKYEQITVRGTERLLRALQPLQVEQFIFSSTMLVHAPCEPGQKINEDWPIDAKWDYPKSKVVAEAVIRRERGGIPAVMMRIAGVYDDQCHSIPIAQQIRRIHLKRFKGHVYPGDVRRGQAFVHLEDLVEAFRLAVERRRQLPAETVLLIGEDQTLSYEELQRTLGELIHGKEWSTWQVPKPVAKAGAWVEEHTPVGGQSFIKPWMIDLADDHYELDISRARKLLGWQPRHTLRETIPKMIDFLKSNPERFYRENKLKMPESMTERE